LAKDLGEIFNKINICESRLVKVKFFTKISIANKFEKLKS